MATFNFKEYLSKIDPKNTYIIKALSGGRVNLTVRAFKAPRTEKDDGRFPGHESIILKYAPAYIAKDGEGSPFSTFRQTIETRALGLFATPNGELTPLSDRWNIKIPQLLYHDLDKHVIIITDLGDLESLTDHFRSMTPLNGKAHEQQELYKELGTRIGGFMADLHSTSTLQKLGSKCRNYFENPAVEEVIRHSMIVPVFSRLIDFSIPNAEVIYNRIEHDHVRPHEHWEQNFRLGDLWTGSVLLDWPRLCIIDWEFAGLGRSVNGDMATIFAQFHLQLLESQPGSSAEAIFNTIIKSTAESYRRRLACISTTASHAQIANVQNSVATDFPIDVLSAIRSSFITHGRKMINNAVERDWKCTCCIDEIKAKAKCCLIKKMLNRGVWYVNVAADSPGEFAEDNNWKEVTKEEGLVILQLFLEC